ncbi:MAG TPA: DUF3786 domain-containing protein [Candidatus Anoxymicrobiaceae bacterium]
MSMMFEGRKAYSIAEAEVRVAVASLDPELTAAERGITFDSSAGRFVVPFLGEDVSVGFPGGEVTGASGKPLSGAVAIVALHYLYYRGEPLRAAGWLAYRDMPGGRDFSRAFESMAESRLADRFGDAPEEFVRVAHSLDGKAGDAGDYSFVIQALPRVHILVILWPSTDDVAGAANILFQPSIPYYLHTEDIAALGIVTAERLCLPLKGRK